MILGRLHNHIRHCTRPNLCSVFSRFLLSTEQEMVGHNNNNNTNKNNNRWSIFCFLLALTLAGIDWLICILIVPITRHPGASNFGGFVNHVRVHSLILHPPLLFLFQFVMGAISWVGWNLNIERNDCRFSQEVRTNMLIMRALKHIVKNLKHNSNISSRIVNNLELQASRFCLRIVVTVTSHFQPFRVWWGLSNMAMNSITTILTVVIIYHLVRYRIPSDFQSWTDFFQEEKAAGCASRDWAN